MLIIRKSDSMNRVVDLFFESHLYDTNETGPSISIIDLLGKDKWDLFTDVERFRLSWRFNETCDRYGYEPVNEEMERISHYKKLQ